MGVRVHDTETTRKVPWWTSCRLTISIMGFLGSTVLYMQRANISVAIVCMTNDPNTTKVVNGTTFFSSVEDDCPNQITDDGNRKLGEFDWSRELRGFVLSSFYIGYLLTQVPGGWLANKFGARIIIGVGMALLSTLTLLTPVAARASVYLLMVVQALKGFVTGVYYPAFYQLMGRWAPPGERTVLIAVFSAGSSIGTVLSSIFSGLLCDKGFDGGWPSIFYVFGAVSVIWCIGWFLIVYSSPDDHPRISKAELEFIKEQLPTVSGEKSLRVPWRELLKTVPMYSIFVVDACYAWVWYVALSSLPQYMKDVLKFDIKKNGLYNSLPYISNFAVSILASILADFIISKRVIKLTWTRKIFQTIALVSSASFSFGVAAITCQQTAVAIVLLTLWVGLLGFIRSGSYINIVDLAPGFVGVLMGIDNTISTIPGIIAPPIVGAMTSRGLTEEWQRVFIVGACISLFGWLVYLIFGRAEETEWSKAAAPEQPTVPQDSTNTHNEESIEMTDH